MNEQASRAVLLSSGGEAIQLSKIAARNSQTRGIVAENKGVRGFQTRSRQLFEVDRQKGRPARRWRSERPHRERGTAASTRRPQRAENSWSVAQSHPGAARHPAPTGARTKAPRTVMIGHPAPGIWRYPGVARAG